MKTAKILILAITVIGLACMSIPVTAATTKEINDPVDDVLMTKFLVDDYTDFEKINSKPNLDIVKISYIYEEGSKEVTAILEVNERGIIEDRNDLDIEDPDFDLNGLNFSGTTISYRIELITSDGLYIIDYIDQNCTVNTETADYTVDRSVLTVNFELDSADETFVSIEGYTTGFEIISLTSMNLYFDPVFELSINAKSEGETGEEIEFKVDVLDVGLDLNEGYTYEWDFDDGSNKETGQSVTHIFQYPGTFDVEVTITDSSNQISTATSQIVITQGSSSGNGNNSGTNGGDSGDNSGFLLFMGIIVVIVIIGVIALIFIIRR
jgi:hypothetical protein